MNRYCHLEPLLVYFFTPDGPCLIAVVSFYQFKVSAAVTEQQHEKYSELEFGLRGFAYCKPSKIHAFPPAYIAGRNNLRLTQRTGFFPQQFMSRTLVPLQPTAAQFSFPSELLGSPCLHLVHLLFRSWPFFSSHFQTPSVSVYFSAIQYSLVSEFFAVQVIICILNLIYAVVKAIKWHLKSYRIQRILANQCCPQR